MSRADLARKAIDWAVKQAEPIVDDVLEAFAAKRAPRPRQKPKVGYDNPGGDWLKYQRKNAAESGRPVSGAVTAYTRKPIMLDPKKVRKLPGHNAERRGPGDMQYDTLRPSVEKHGLYEKSPILIGVNYRGDPYIIEGNTRTAVADDLGLPELPAEIRWFAGGEEMPDALLRPDNIEEFMAQSELMRDPNFRNWFGNSKLVDQYGEPQRFYHSTPADFDVFDPATLGQNTKDATSKLGFFFAQDPASTDPFMRPSSGRGEYLQGANTLPVYLTAKNPHEMNWRDFSNQVLGLRSLEKADAGRAVADFVSALQGAGHDALRIKGGWKQHDLLGGPEFASDNMIVFYPTQIKSAIGNRGSFDPMDPDITKAKGGLAVKPVWDKKRPKDLGKSKPLSVKKKAFAKRRAEAAGRPYPNLVDNLAAARKKGK